MQDRKSVGGPTVVVPCPRFHEVIDLMKKSQILTMDFAETLLILRLRA
jgi:hypothetical protein